MAQSNKNFLDFTSDIIFRVNEDKEILELNLAAEKFFSNPKNISQLEHLFSFVDICVLDSENILSFTPLIAAFESKEDFFSDCLFQVSEFEYRNIYIRSYSQDAQKLFIIQDYTDSLRAVDYFAIKQELESLKKENEQASELRQKAEIQTLRTSLVNMLSTAIREIIDIDKIIDVVTSETSKTLQVFKSCFVLNSDHPQIKYKYGEFSVSQESQLIEEIKNIKNNLELTVSSVLDDNELRPRIISPIVYNDVLYGYLVLYRKNNQQLWNPEEVTLVEGVSSQLATAFNQASLFDKLNSQKQKLENTVNELHNTQAQLVQSEKMASLGQLVAGVAHEINTPLGTINSNLSMIDRCLEKFRNCIDGGNESKAYSMALDANRINKEAVNRINKIVKNLKNFARLDESEMKSVDIHDGIKSTLELLRHETKDKVTIVEDFSTIPDINCYPDLLNQVFMNILMNAIQSIDEKGTITIKTRELDNNIHISFTDTGKGIKEADISRVFDPGFTTKGVGVGTGLGLSITHKIIEKHNGFIRVYSKECQGTTFEIILPM